jgi:hypothetical protein
VWLPLNPLPQKGSVETIMLDEHLIERAEDDRRLHPPECHVFVSEESRVAVKQLMILMTPENIQFAERWLERGKAAENSAWKTFVNTLRLSILLVVLTVLYHMTQSDFTLWLRKAFNK